MCASSRFFFSFFFFSHSFFVLFCFVFGVVLVFLTISNFLPSTFHHSIPTPFEFRSQIFFILTFCWKIDDLLCCVLVRSWFVCSQLCVAVLGLLEFLPLSPPPYVFGPLPPPLFLFLFFGQSLSRPPPPPPRIMCVHFCCLCVFLHSFPIFFPTPLPP